MFEFEDAEINGGNFTEGAMFVADGVRKHGDDFTAGSTAFEFVQSTANGIRRVDVKVGNIFYEFKSVLKAPPLHFAEQFVKDLQNVVSLDQIKWWFDKKKLDALKKSDFLDLLDGIDLDKAEIDKFFPGQSNVPLDVLVDKIDALFETIFFIK